MNLASAKTSETLAKFFGKRSSYFFRLGLLSCLPFTVLSLLVMSSNNANALSTPHEEEVQRAPASLEPAAGSVDPHANDEAQTESKPVKQPKIEMKAIKAPASESTNAEDSSEQMTVVLKKASAKSAAKPEAKSETKLAKKTNSAHDEPAAEAKQAKAGQAEHGNEEAEKGVAADTAMKWLQNGNMRFVKKQYRADGRDAKDRARLVAGQKPHTIVLSCSDSRVPPELVFDQALGEIFVIRVAGEALSPSVIASIEYAVAHLGPKLLVVLGHTSCGAIKATISLKEGESAGSTALDALVEDIKPRLKTVASEEPSPNLEVESALNADGVARDLVKRSEIIRGKVKAGQLVIKSALYRLDSGKVTFY